MRKKYELTKKELRARSRRRLVLVELLLLFVLTAGIAAWLYFGIESVTDVPKLARGGFAAITRDQPFIANIINTNSGDFKYDGYRTIALFGVDNRSVGEYETGNSDCIMVCAVDNDAQEVRIASIYRDTFLDTADGSYHKANYAYDHGGVEEALAMLRRNLDIDVTDYVVVDFVALVDAVDAVGGIDLDEGLTEAEASHMDCGEVAALSGKDTQAAVAGQTHLDGVQTVTYCRIRHTDSDFIRAQRQRRVLEKLIEKAKAASLPELAKIVEAVLPEVSTNLSVTEIMELASAYREYALTETTGFPFDKRGAEYRGRGQVVVPCTLESNVRKLHFFLYREADYLPSEDLLRISSGIEAYTGFSENAAIDYGKYDTVDRFGVEQQ
ncbi:MAG: LCP family protein [Lachnospiraceae bacterium]|nr:LCP family protein [Lachnospiraceae bacterium]